MSLDQANSSNLMWKIAGGLIVISGLAATYVWLDADQPIVVTSSPEHASVHPIAEPTQLSPTVQAEAVKPVDSDNPSNPTIDAHALVQDSILQDKVPDHSSLAKEEVAKLDDIQDQLATQQKTLEAQQADADQLIQLKEEQIKILEQQLLAQK